MRCKIDVPDHAILIAISYCRAFAAWDGKLRLNAAQAEIVQTVEDAARKVMWGEERLLRDMIRCVGYRVSYHNAPHSLIMSYSEGTYKRRKHDIVTEIVNLLGIA